ncbi:hypothetical protein SFRURICE_003813, partial [Spodoptera frugiperda]
YSSVSSVRLEIYNFTCTNDTQTRNNLWIILSVAPCGNRTRFSPVSLVRLRTYKFTYTSHSDSKQFVDYTYVALCGNRTRYTATTTTTKNEVENLHHRCTALRCCGYVCLPPIIFIGTHSLALVKTNSSKLCYLIRKCTNGQPLHRRSIAT